MRKKHRHTGENRILKALIRAAAGAGAFLGYKKLITYILKSEPGSSLKAAGWKCVGECGGLRWTGRSRPEVDLYPAQMKLRFEIETNTKEEAEHGGENATAN